MSTHSKQEDVIELSRPQLEALCQPAASDSSSLAETKQELRQKLECDHTKSDSGDPDELLSFLSYFAWLYPNLNDTFAYACADTERIWLDIEVDDSDDSYISNGEVLVKAWREFGFSGIVAVVGRMRGQDPIAELRTEDYDLAKKSLADWEYESEWG